MFFNQWSGRPEKFKVSSGWRIYISSGSSSRRAAHGFSYTNTSYMCDEERAAAAAVKIVVKVQVKVGTRAHSV